MSRVRLIASLIVVSCSVVFAVTLAAWTFPLKSAPPVAQSRPRDGIAWGIAAGVSGGVKGGINGGIKGGINGRSADQASVDRNSIWIDTVKRGSMVRQVRGLGTIVPGDSSEKLVARVTLPASMTVEIHAGENATVDTREGFVKGHVIRVNGSPADETRTVDVGLDGALPEGAGVNLTVDATIDIGKLDDVLWIHRPVHTAANTSKPLFRIVGDGTAAERLNVKFGRASAETIEVLGGLKVGDEVILSDMSDLEKFERIHLK